MNKLITATLISFILAGCNSSSSNSGENGDEDFDINSNLIVHMNFENDVNEYEWLVGTPSATDGVNNSQAVHFDGQSALRIVACEDESMDAVYYEGDKTVSFWYMFDDVDFNGDDQNKAREQYLVTVDESDEINRFGYILRLKDNSLTSWQSGNYTVHSDVNGGLPENGQWNHYALVQTGDITRVYQNGQYNAESDVENENLKLIQNGDIYLGAYDYNSEMDSARLGFKGAIDEFRIYNKALTSNQIKALMEETK